MIIILYLLGKPGKPDKPIVQKASSKSVTLTWQPPKDDGGAEIVNYVVEYRKDGMHAVRFRFLGAILW